MRLSASRLKLLSECKKQFYHRYILEDIEYEDSPFGDMGTAVHLALEKYRQYYPKMTRKQMIGVYNHHFHPEPEFDWLKKQGFKLLWKLDLSKVVLGELVDVEFPFEEVINGIHIRGIIDKIELVEDNKLIVTDYKTNMSISPEKHFPQIAIYDMVMQHQFPDAEIEYELFYVRYNKVVPFKLSDTFHEKTQETALSVINYVNENRDNPSVWTKMSEKKSMCDYCPLIKSCWG